MLGRVKQVRRQTRARVFRGNMHVEGKLASMFENTTEIIRRGKAKQPTEFGKMIKVQEAEGQIIVDYEVFEKRPADSDLLAPAIAIHQQRLGRVPDLAAGDAGFYSDAGEKKAHPNGSEICFGAESFDQKRGAQKATEDTMVPEGAEMADRLRRPHQRAEAAPRVESLSLQRRQWNEAMGGSRRHQ